MVILIFQMIMTIMITAIIPSGILIANVYHNAHGRLIPQCTNMQSCEWSKLAINYPYPEPVVIQWQSSVSGTWPQCTLECHWKNKCWSPECFQCASSGLPVAFKWCSSVSQLCELTPGIASGTPLGASISQCSSSGIPVYFSLQWSSSLFQSCKLTLNRHWDTTGC